MTDHSARLAVVEIQPQSGLDICGFVIIFDSKSALLEFQCRIREYFVDRDSGDALNVALSNEGGAVTFALDVSLSNGSLVLLIEQVDPQVIMLAHQITANQRYYFVLTALAGSGDSFEPQFYEGGYFFKCDIYLDGLNVNCSSTGVWSDAVDPFL